MVRRRNFYVFFFVEGERGRGIYRVFTIGSVFLFY